MFFVIFIFFGQNVLCNLHLMFCRVMMIIGFDQMTRSALLICGECNNYFPIRRRVFAAGSPRFGPAIGTTITIKRNLGYPFFLFGSFTNNFCLLIIVQEELTQVDGIKVRNKIINWVGGFWICLELVLLHSHSEL